MDITTTEIIVRVLVAIGLASVLGLERTFAGKTAGMRTYAMVAIGSSLFALISEYILASGANASATSAVVIPGAVITGIGFIGAGLVLFQPDHHKVAELTTAAGLWVSAGVGMAAGFGFFELALVGTIAALVVFIIFWFIEHQLLKFSHHRNIGSFDREDGAEK